MGALVRHFGALLVIATTALYTWGAQPLSAQSTNLPSEDFIGYWAVGSCTDAAARLVSNGLSVVVFQGADFGAVVSVVDARFSANAIQFKLDGAPTLVPSKQLARCDGLPSRLQLAFGEAAELFIGYGHFLIACAEVGGNCARDAIDLVDVNGDELLSRAELSRAARGAAFFLGYEAAVELKKNGAAPQPTSVTASELYGTSIASNLVSPLLASNLLASYDFDDDGSLAVSEILQDRQTVLADDLPLLVGREALQSGVGGLVSQIRQLLGKGMAGLLP